MSPAHPPVKCFFSSKDMNVFSSYSRIFEAEFALKSRGFDDFGSPSGQDKCVKDFVSITYEAQGVLEKNIMSYECVKANPTLPVDGRIHSARRARKHCLK